MASRPKCAPTDTIATAVTGFYLRSKPPLPCPLCKAGELFRYTDRFTGEDEFVCLECEGIIPNDPVPAEGGAE